MPFLYLIRHPKTQFDPDVPASLWQLSNEGQAQVEALIDAPIWACVTTVYTSDQYKAWIVGSRIRSVYGIPFVSVPDLAEAQRDEWIGEEQFFAAQAAFFALPDRSPVSSWESADAAKARFVAAMESILERHPKNESIALVSHATVLTLYVAHLVNESPSYDAWSQLGFAEIMAMDRGSLRPMTAFLPPPYDGLPYHLGGRRS